MTITGTFDICDICGWEHDPVQESDPDNDDMGPNRVTSKQAQLNFASFGAKTKEASRYCRRVEPEDRRDVNWKPLA